MHANIVHRKLRQMEQVAKGIDHVPNNAPNNVKSLPGPLHCDSVVGKAQVLGFVYFRFQHHGCGSRQ